MVASFFDCRRTLRLILLFQTLDRIRCFQAYSSTTGSVLHLDRSIRPPSNFWQCTSSTTSLSSSQKNSVFTQVISDVDDTLKSSGGLNVAGVTLGGIDVQYPRGDFYPGVAEFMLEISRYGIADAEAAVPPKVAILTARAEEFKVALEIKSNSKLAVAMRTAGERAGISGWGVGPVLYGSVAEWIVQYRKGLRKFTNFERLLQQDPSGMIVQVGNPLQVASTDLMNWTLLTFCSVCLCR